MPHAAVPMRLDEHRLRRSGGKRFGRHLPVSRHDLRAARHEMMILMMGEVAERCDECHTD